MDETEVRIACYVLGTLDSEERRSVEQLLANDDEARALQRAWEARLAPLAKIQPEIPPPAGVWDAITSELGLSGGRRPTSVFADQGVWLPIGPGLAIKYLNVDPDTDERTILFKMEPGAVYEAHHHFQAEECLIVDGTVAIAGRVFHRGDFHIAPAGTRHDTIFSAEGGTMILHWNARPA